MTGRQKKEDSKTFEYDRRDRVIIECFVVTLSYTVHVRSVI